MSKEQQEFSEQSELMLWVMGLTLEAVIDEMRKEVVEKVNAIADTNSSIHPHTRRRMVSAIEEVMDTEARQVGEDDGRDAA